VSTVPVDVGQLGRHGHLGQLGAADVGITGLWRGPISARALFFSILKSISGLKILKFIENRIKLGKI
jgi:hypothetical protein